MTVQTIQDSRSGDKIQSPPLSYSPDDLVGETYLGLFLVGALPPGPMPDPEGAHQAAADLLRAFGVTPAVSA